MGSTKTSIMAVDLIYDGQGVRIEGTPDAPLFRALDCCRVLGIEHPTTAYRRIPESQKATVGTTHGGPDRIWLTTGGLFSLIFQSRKVEAERFRLHVTDEVLPSIAKYGCYPPPLHLTKAGNALVRTDAAAFAEAVRPVVKEEIAHALGPIREDIVCIRRGIERVPQHRKDVKEHTKWQGIEVIRRKYDGKDPSDLTTQILAADGRPLDLEWDHWASRGLCSPEHVWPISRKNNRDLAEPGSPQRKAVEHLFRTYQQHRELMFGKGRPSDVKTAKVKARQGSLFDAS